MTATLNLPEHLAAIVEPVFEMRPPAKAMSTLVVGRVQSESSDGEPQHALVRLIERIQKQDELAENPAIMAGLWLYADELERSHEISQNITTPSGAYWHAIMHRREGEFSNSKYWYRKVGRHPVIRRINPAGGGAGSGTDVGNYDPFDFVDRVERAAHNQSVNHPELVSIQRREWQALFEYSAEH